MAEFSKQWCELNDPQMPWDFDIIKEWNDLEIGYIMPIICEGFGFVAIGKLSSDPMMPKVFFPDEYDGEDGRWVNITDLLDHSAHR